MPVTVPEAFLLLQQCGYRAYTDFGSMVLLHRSCDGGLISILVRISQDGAIMRFTVPAAVQMPAKRRNAVVARLLARNFWSELVRFSVHSADEPINLDICLPVMDGEVTAAQVRRCVDALIQETERIRRSVAEIVATGKCIDDSPCRVMHSVYELLSKAYPEEATAEGGAEGDAEGDEMLRAMLAFNEGFEALNPAEPDPDAAPEAPPSAGADTATDPGEAPRRQRPSGDGSSAEGDANGA